MRFDSVAIALPIRDRRTSHDFFTQALGVEAHGAPASDGIPEPLQFQLNPGVSVVLIPAGGFKWVIGDRAVAGDGVTESLVSLERDTVEEVADLVERARRAGATVTSEPAPQPWGYEGAFTDPDGHLWVVAARAVSA